MSLETLVRQANPYPPADLGGPDSPEAREILERVLKGEPRRHRRVPRRFVPLGVAAAVGAAAALVLILILPGSPSSPDRAPNAAAATFDQLARVAAKQSPNWPIPPGKFWYTSSLGTGPTTTCYVKYARPFCLLSQPTHFQSWLGADGSSRQLDTRQGTLSFRHPADRAAWIADGRPSVTIDTAEGPRTSTSGDGQVSSLSSNPAVLATQIFIKGGPTGPSGHLDTVIAMLSYDLPPAVRAALFKIAASIPGVVDLGTVTDSVGRRGEELVRVDSDGSAQEYIFDPSTSSLLQGESIALRGGAEGAPPGAVAGTVFDVSVILSSGLVDSLSATPTGSVSPPPPYTCVALRWDQPYCGPHPEQWLRQHQAASRHS